LFVAITRARTRLYLSFAQTRLLHGQTRYNVASRFLDEIPAGITRWLTARFGSRTADGQVSTRDWPSPPSAPLSISAAPKATSSGYRIGQSVTHAKFGQGVIVNTEGSGADARVQINFGRQGMKWLALEYAKLTPA
jgi:DNA helicase-2/ATP-dependent DNA helicase PcrA